MWLNYFQGLALEAKGAAGANQTFPGSRYMNSLNGNIRHKFKTKHDVVSRFLKNGGKQGYLENYGKLWIQKLREFYHEPVHVVNVPLYEQFVEQTIGFME